MTLPVHSALTPREAQVLQRLIEGRTTRQIAESYGIGHQTVKNYVTVIYEKLGVCRRAQLMQVTGASGPRGGQQVHEPSGQAAAELNRRDSASSSAAVEF